MGSSMGMESTTIAMDSSTAEPELFIGTEEVWREATEEPLEPTPNTEEPEEPSSTEKPSDDLPDDAYALLANFIASMGIVTLVRKLPCHIPLYVWSSNKPEIPLQAIYGLGLTLAVNIYCCSRRIFFVANYNTIS